MKKSLPEKIETKLVKDFLNEALDIKLGQFETRIDEKLGQFEMRIDEKFETKFRELTKKVDLVGVLISNTHQEVKHFIELHKVLDDQVKQLERRVNRLEHLFEKLAH